MKLRLPGKVFSTKLLLDIIDLSVAFLTVYVLMAIIYFAPKLQNKSVAQKRYCLHFDIVRRKSERSFRKKENQRKV